MRWDSHDERTSLIHTGVDARHHLNDSLDLIARFEGVHRMEDASSGSSGQILGLNAFELQGVSYKQDWLPQRPRRRRPSRAWNCNGHA